MYVNQIDDIIDKILDKLYLENLSKDSAFKLIIKKINFVEYREGINNFIQKFMETIDVDLIYSLIQNRANLIRILDIIKRYVAYYYFLTLAYYYPGTIKEFRNNLIQYSKLQEGSDVTIKNFFDTENNYQVVLYFKIVKDVSKIITMTELQRKALNPLEIKDAINFLSTIDTNYVNNYLLKVTKTKNGDLVEVNAHNLIKTIVFGEIYRNQERTLIFEILNDIEETKAEYTFIDIVTETKEKIDFSTIKQMFIGEDENETIARDLFELIQQANKIPIVDSPDLKNNNLLDFKHIIPIVDDFLRYHRDSEKLDVLSDKAFTMPLTSTNNAKNVQLALIYQQRKKKENTKAQIIVNKIDAISDFYSANIKNNPELHNEIKRYFQNVFAYRKSVFINYLDEVYVMNKIAEFGKKVTEGNEYYLELVETNRKAYFNFKDFQKYGATLNMTSNITHNLLRYNNIENQNQLAHLELDMHTSLTGRIIDLVGLALRPIATDPTPCARKDNLLDIRNLKITYPTKTGEPRTRTSENGYKTFLNIVKYFFINTINFQTPDLELYNDMTEITKLNPHLLNQVIFWSYDIEKDEYEAETYENVKVSNYQEVIKLMNSRIYDKTIQYLNARLIHLIETNNNLSYFQILTLIEKFSTVYRLFLKQNDVQELIIQRYLHTIPIEETKIIKVSGKLSMPEFIPIKEEEHLKLEINMRNPKNLRTYRKLSVYQKDDKEPIGRKDTRCQHEIEWKDINKLRKNLDKYNIAVTQFIEKYSIETNELDFVCRVCGQILPLKKYAQDGIFDNSTQRVISSYVPLDVPLESMPEYINYQLSVRYLDGLVNRVSLITGTNMLTGNNVDTNQRRTGLVKNIIDLIIKHNSINLAKKIKNETRLEAFAKQFNINKDYDSVFFFEMNDSVFDFTPISTEINANINRLKFNNVLLYFILLFMTELNGIQIYMMTGDKIANVYTYLEYGPKLFGGLLIKKNVNDAETVPITHYPVFCYLIFILSYYLIKYKLWYYPTTNGKVFNPNIQKVIINSLVDLFNSICIDAGTLPDDYTYLLTVSKLYTQLNNTFINVDIINVLKQRHSIYDKTKQKNGVITKAKKILALRVPITIILKPHKIPDFQLTSGVAFDTLDKLLYRKIEHNNDITNCPDGSFQVWRAQGKTIIGSTCEEASKNADGKINRVTENYYYNLEKIAQRRCLDGRAKHDFVAGECTLCHRQPNDTYTEAELDQLASSLNLIEDNRTQESLEQLKIQNKENEDEANLIKSRMENLIANYQKEFKSYGQIDLIIEKLITLLEEYIGSNINLNIDKYPIFLRENVYIIDHTYDGSPLAEPIIITQKDQRIIFRENHPFFKTDVYYYADNKNQIEVFYHASSLALLGYKEKYKDYVLARRSINHLQINLSIKQRFIDFGFKTKYLDISNMTPSYNILNAFIADHILKITSIVNKIVAILNKIKNYQQPSEEPILQSEIKLNMIVNKYGELINDLKLGKSFRDWEILRTSFTYQKINWSETNIKIPDGKFLNTEVISHYDTTSNIILYYLVTEWIKILTLHTDKISKINISQLYIEIINYMYNSYNTDKYKNILEVKRFQYIINGSIMLIDLMRKGKEATKQFEEHLDDIRADTTELGEEENEELEDLKEEAEAIDVDTDFYSEEEE